MLAKKGASEVETSTRPRPIVYDQPLIVKLESGLKRRLKMEAASQGTDMSKITRDAIEKYLDDQQKKRERRARGQAA
jgi:predicted transcriptional regulator